MFNPAFIIGCLFTAILLSRLAYGEEDLPVSERAADEVLSLPLHASLEDGQVDHVIEAVLQAVSS